MIPEFSSFLLRTRIIMGSEVLATLPDELARLGMGKIFIVTDEGVSSAGLIEYMKEYLGEIQVVGTFSNVPADSPLKVVKSLSEEVKVSGAHGMVAMGGGSVIDAAKGANIEFSLGGSILDYEGAGLIDSPLKPLAAIPTTAGSGSEVSAFTVIHHQEEKSKLSFFSPYLCPDLAVLAPKMTVTMPGVLTAETGMDALTHAFEAYLSTEANYITDGLALQAIADIIEYLPLAYVRGVDEEFRFRMALASTSAGLAFSNAFVGCVHALAHAMGGILGLPHGRINGMLLPYGLEFNLSEVEKKLCQAAGYLRIEGEGRERAINLIGRVRSLAKDLGFPASLQEAGVEEEKLQAIAELASVDGAIFTNPKEATQEDLLKVLEKAHEGGEIDGVL